jgi:hypothetical protein
VASSSQARGSPGVVLFGLGMAATFGVISVGVVLLTVSLPDGLKFVLAAISGMLAMVCIGLSHLIGQHVRQ